VKPGQLNSLPLPTSVSSTTPWFSVPYQTTLVSLFIFFVPFSLFSLYLFSGSHDYRGGQNFGQFIQNSLLLSYTSHICKTSEPPCSLSREMLICCRVFLLSMLPRHSNSNYKNNFVSLCIHHFRIFTVSFFYILHTILSSETMHVIWNFAFNIHGAT
jgi:hypothetical protein